MPTVDEPNEKIREQIEEILEEDEKRTPSPPRRTGPVQIARPVAPRKVRASGIPLWYPTPEKLIVLGLALLLIAVIVRSAVLPLTLGGFALAGIGYYMLVMKRRRAKYGVSPRTRSDSAAPQYWRGKPVKPNPPVKKRDGNVLEFPDSIQSKRRRWFGKKK